MRTALLTELGEWSASTRYRALQLVPGLQQRLGQVDVFLPNDQPIRAPGRRGQVRYFGAHTVRYLQRAREVRRVLRHYDAVFIQRGLYGLGPSYVARALTSFPGRVVFDLDDAAFELKPSLADRGAVTRWLYGPQQARRVLARADAVVVSSQVLADSLPNISRAGAPVRVLPTVPDPARYIVSDQSRVSADIVWAGTVGNLGYLDPLRAVFSALERTGAGRLTVVCSHPWSGPSHFRPWRLAEEPSSFADFSVGIMPLPDTPYTRAKAGFKLLQYMAAGVPVVASPVGVNVDLVEHSGGGLLASTPEQWREALTRLLGSPELRQQLGDAGRAFVHRYADLGGRADTVAALLRGDPDGSAADPERA